MTRPDELFEQIKNAKIKIYPPEDLDEEIEMNKNADLYVVWNDGKDNLFQNVDISFNESSYTLALKPNPPDSGWTFINLTEVRYYKTFPTTLRNREYEETVSSYNYIRSRVRALQKSGYFMKDTICQIFNISKLTYDSMVDDEL